MPSWPVAQVSDVEAGPHANRSHRLQHRRFVVDHQKSRKIHPRTSPFRTVRTRIVLTGRDWRGEKSRTRRVARTDIRTVPLDRRRELSKANTSPRPHTVLCLIGTQPHGLSRRRRALTALAPGAAASRGKTSARRKKPSFAQPVDLGESPDAPERVGLEPCIKRAAGSSSADRQAALCAHIPRASRRNMRPACCDVRRPPIWPWRPRF